MPGTENELFKALSDAVVGMDEDSARLLATEAVERGIDAYTAIERGLVDWWTGWVERASSSKAKSTSSLTSSLDYYCAPMPCTQGWTFFART
jgi:hypothetical protein